jgi:putative membrane protein
MNYPRAWLCVTSLVSAPPAPTWPAVLARWSVEPAVLALLVVAATAYGWGRRTHRAPGAALYGTGLAVVAVALLSPLSTYAAALLSAHMTQHLLLAFVAAPLLVAAHPGPVLLAGLPPRVAALLRSVATTPVSRVATSPVVAWMAFAATGWLVHFTPLFDLALEHPLVHAVEHALFLGTGLLYWRPVLGNRPLSYPGRLFYLALGMPQNTFLALAIVVAGHPLYEAYERLARAWGPSLLDDQRQGGGIMWVAGDLTLLVAVLVVAARWATREGAGAASEG